jgi:RNA 3'-terminal phosphate cyclase
MVSQALPALSDGHTIDVAAQNNQMRDADERESNAGLAGQKVGNEAIRQLSDALKVDLWVATAEASRDRSRVRGNDEVHGAIGDS